MPFPNLAAKAPPAWVFRDAAFDLDFRNGRWWGGSIGTRTNFGNLITVSNGGVNGAYTGITADGKVRIFDANQFRNVLGVGLYAEASKTNRALHSRDLTQASAWTVGAGASVSRNQPGADVDATPNTATLITATTGGSTATVLQSITLASSQVIFSAFVRRVSGSGTVEMTQDGGATWVDITSQLNSIIYVRPNTGAATVTNPQIGFRLATTGNSIAVDFVQLEQGATVSTPKITTTTTRGLGAELHSFGDDGSSYNDGQRLIDTTHYNRLPMSQYIEFSGDFDGVTVATILGGGNLTTGRIQAQTSGVVRLNSSGLSVDTANTLTNGLGNINKVATRSNGAGGAICLNAGAIASSTGPKINLTDPTDDHIGIGNRGAGDQSLNGYIRRITFWRRELTDGEMLELTR
ncbi:hypothetical protein J8F10_08905 [Gemmata sp. G18]|uniref:LamG domain-containing protein n=1 Tax=Gemmata palustris TaxID=2822762 RepID=A0ABS5BNU8_9BACT|nr:hypothetical protein [Gemmata palustris]MBP3955398.1 hypothetical protein [Gemmata palustris]